MPNGPGNPNVQKLLVVFDIVRVFLPKEDAILILITESLLKASLTHIVVYLM